MGKKHHKQRRGRQRAVERDESLTITGFSFVSGRQAPHLDWHVESASHTAIAGKPTEYRVKLSNGTWIDAQSDSPFASLRDIAGGYTPSDGDNYSTGVSADVIRAIAAKVATANSEPYRLFMSPEFAQMIMRAEDTHCNGVTHTSVWLEETDW